MTDNLDAVKVELVARALYEEWQGPEPSLDSSVPWDQLHEAAKSGWRSSAQAAITALSARTPSAGAGEIRKDSDFAWKVPRHPTEAMMRAGLYHCSADMEWADLFTAFHHMVDAAECENDAAQAALSARTPSAGAGEMALRIAMALHNEARRFNGLPPHTVEQWHKLEPHMRRDYERNADVILSALSEGKSSHD